VKYLKNVLIKNLVTLFKQKNRIEIDSQEKRFLIVSTTALGDTLWATPAIKALRAAYPHSDISMLVSPIGREVLLNNPYINDLFLVKNPALPSLLSLYGTLKKKTFSHIFIFHTSQRPVLPCTALLGAPVLIGSAGINKGLDALLTECQPRNPQEHEIERRLKMVARVGAHASTVEMDLFLNQDDESLAQEWLHSLAIPSYLPLIALHPGAKDAFRRWPASHFIELGKRLSAHLGCTVFVTGVPSEKELVETIASGIEGAIPVTHLPLRAFAALIKKMRLIVTNDTGPMHVALAMKTPSVLLFSPSNPKRFGPYGVKKATVIAKKASCSPCLTRKCPSSFCLLQIGVQEVYDAALNLFHNSF